MPLPYRRSNHVINAARSRVDMKVVSLALVGAAIVGGAFHLQWDVDRWTEVTNRYASLVNALMTFVIMSVTIFYAWVTRQMLAEHAEARRAAIRPLFWLKPTPPSAESEHSVVAFEISNIGHGVGYRTTITASILQGTTETMIEVSSEIPSALLSGAAITVHIPVRAPVSSTAGEPLLVVDVTTFDIEGNLYLLHTVHRTDAWMLEQQRRWIPTFLVLEELYLLSFFSRRFVDTDWIRLNHEPHARYFERIYSRGIDAA